MDAHSPNGKIATWLAQLGASLESNDIEAAKGLFAEDCYWRDFLTFTWNLKTSEGRDQIGEMLTATLGTARPSNFALVGEASEADGITEGWISFETDVARGEGHLRLKRRRRLDAADRDDRAQGFRGKEGPEPPQRRRARDRREPLHVAGRSAQGSRDHGLRRAALRAGDRRRTGRYRPGRTAAADRRARNHHREETTVPATAGASAIARSACTIRYGTTTCHTCRSPSTGRCSAPRTRSVTGWKATPRSWS